MLDSITIHRFKNIKQITVPLGRINILIGSNNSGKSSVLQALQFAVSVAQTMKLLGSQWKKDNATLSFAPSQLVYVPLRQMSAVAHNQNFSEHSSTSIDVSFAEKKMKVPAQGGEAELTTVSTTIKVVRGRGQNIQCSIRGAELGRTLQPIAPPFSVFVPGLAGIPLVEEQKSAVVVRRAAARGDANNVFRNVLWLLKQNATQWTQFQADFRRVFPDRSIEVRFNPEQDEHIHASIISNGAILPIDAAGTGVLQAVQILAYINWSQPKLLILDEPDAHLHPNNQRRLADVLVDLAEERSFQVVLSTHSRHILDALRNDSKIHWIRTGVRVPDEQYSDVEVLLEVGALDRGDLLKSGKTTCVVLTEDDEVSCIEALLGSGGFRMNETEIWPYKGCSNRETALALCGFIAAHAPAVKVVVHRDRDYLTPDEAAEYEAGIKKGAPQAFVFLTKGTDAESEFLVPEHFHQLNAKLEPVKVQQIIEQATTDSAEHSVTAFINSRTPVEGDFRF